MKFFRSMYNCDMQGLPTETLSDTFIRHVAAFKDYKTCFDKSSASADSKGLVAEHVCLERSSVSDLCAVNSSARPSSVFNSIAQNCHHFLEVTRNIPDLQLTSTPKVVDMFNHTANESISDHKVNAFIQHRMCMNQVNKRVNQCAMQTKVSDICKNARIIFAKVLRLKMNFIEPVLRDIPELKIIHYIRNPLAIVSSRSMDAHSKHWVHISKRMCTEMKSDIDAVASLQNSHQDNFFRLRYEDMVQKPHKVLTAIYDWIGEQTPPGLEDWLLSTMYAANDGNKYEVRRTNASAHIDKWRLNVPESVTHEVTQSDECKDLLETLGYSNSQH